MPDQPGLPTRDFRDGKPRLLNIFASWCVPCVAEIPILLRLKAQGVDMAGVAIHDIDRGAGQVPGGQWQSLQPHRAGQTGRAQMAFGSAGVPETFVVDGKGKIIHQQIGVVTEADLPELLAMLGRPQ